jgi:putative ABC transport system ATP-binding protein
MKISEIPRLLNPGEPRSHPAVVSQQLSKDFPLPRNENGATRVLDDIGFAAYPGELVAIVGPSGSGKSTLLYCLAGLEPVTSGQVGLLGADLAALTRDQRARLRAQHVGFVFQRLNLVGSLTARANVELPTNLAGRNVDPKQTDAVMRLLGIRERADYLPREMSGGEQQRVALARVWLRGPSVVFADEPTGSLDSATSRVVMDRLKDSAKSGACVVMVTHDLELAAEADRVVVLLDGRVHAEIAAPSPSDVLSIFEGLRSGKK